MPFRLRCFTLFFAAVLVANADQPTHIPLSNPGQPARIIATLMNSGISVQAADIPDIIIEGGHPRVNGRPSRDDDEESQGMKRIYPPGPTGFTVDEDHNTIRIKTSLFDQSSSLSLTVPRRVSLQLKSVNNGGIHVDGVQGEIDVDNVNGGIELNNVAGSVLAHSLNGAIHVIMNRIDPGKPMSFSTLNGRIDVTLPADTRATVRLKTDNGAIYSDFDVNLTADGMTDTSGRDSDGARRIRFDRIVRGTINGGGPEYQFTTINGRIYIHKHK